MVFNEERPLKIINAFENKSAAIMRLQNFDDRFLYVVKYLDKNNDIELVIHMGANSSTTETNFRLIYNINTRFTRNLWKWCTKNKVRFIYASSAATYGDGSKGFDDSISIVYKPLNIYGLSKYLFDRYAIKEAKKKNCPPQWVGLKFFNVYGPNEYHKGSMQSVVKHAIDQYNICLLYTSPSPRD